MKDMEYRYRRPVTESRFAIFARSAPVPILFGLLVPAILTCARPSGQNLLYDWQRSLVEVSYYVVCMVYLSLSLKTALEAKYPRAAAYLLAPICAGLIRLTQPGSCDLMHHWQDILWYESGIRNLF